MNFTGTWLKIAEIYNYLCNEYLSPLKLWVRLPNLIQHYVIKFLWLEEGLWCSLCTPVTFTNKTDLDDIAEILLKIALNTITLVLTLGLLFLKYTLTAFMTTKICICWPFRTFRNTSYHSWFFVRMCVILDDDLFVYFIIYLFILVYILFRFFI